jgi:hypothetical protein
MKLKLSTIMAIIAMMQFAFTLGLAKEWWTSSLGFSLMHEDLILTINFMTWFIVASIEKCKERTTG